MEQKVTSAAAPPSPRLRRAGKAMADKKITKVFLLSSLTSFPFVQILLSVLLVSPLPADELVVESDLSVEGNVEVTGETGATANPGIHVTGDGGVLFQDTHGTGQIPVEGTGTRFMWYPGKAALRAGSVSWDEWNESNVGQSSVAMGNSTIASSYYSLAMGYFSTASGYASTAMGSFSTASGWASTAMGDSTTASDWASTAMGDYTTASGGSSTAMGDSTTASGWASTAMGFGTSASGYYSTAMGSFSTASGESSTAMGDSTTASGDSSTAMGVETLADSYASVAIGRYNVGGGNPTQWNPEDPLFEIGNGTGDSQDPPEVQNSNALTVYKSGKIIIHEPQGDILMGEFGEQE